ncbi:MAG TPA: hypothetical protein VGI66_07335 [Streptosporangiaceae bacterium]
MAVSVAGITVVGLTALVSPAFATPGPGTSVIYNSVVASPLPGNVPSVGAEAYSFNEFGNEVKFSGTSTNRSLTNVVVEMSSWGCVTGHWYSGDCATPPGATFDEPITFNVYGPSTNGRPGALIASATQTFAIPYRPSASPKCGAGDGRWYDSKLRACFNGLATTINFSFSGVTLPDQVVYGITYNTSHYGYHPVGQSTACYASPGGCGYDSLNIALSQDPGDVAVGGDTNPGTVWQYSNYGSDYCDGGTAGTGVFRLDSPGVASCWVASAPNAPVSYYAPAVQFKAGVRNG